MSWQRLLATGLGSVRFRLSIQSHPDEFVSHESQELAADPAADVRRRIALLQSRSFKLSERVSLVDAEIDSSGFTAEIVDVRKQATRSFHRAPTARTVLEANVSHAATTIPVLSTDGFDESGLLWLNAEVIYYTGKTTTSFTGCVRGQMDTLARAHFANLNDGLINPEITNLPVTMEGRRATLYAYGEGDDPQGPGTQIWRGVVATQPRYNGTRYSILIDPITRVLKQTVGGYLDTPPSIRGIYYGSANPLFIHIYESLTDTAGGAMGPEMKFAMCGFWETQAAFIAALQAEIDARWATTGATSTITVGHDGAAWGIRFTTASSSPRMVVMNTTMHAAAPIVSYTDGRFAEWPIDESTGERIGEGGSHARPVAAGATYLYRLEDGDPAGAGTVPRGTWGVREDDPRAPVIGRLPAADRVGFAGTRPRRLYVDGDLQSTFSRLVCKIDANGHGEEGDINEEIRVNTIDNHVEIIGSSPPPLHVITSANPVELQFLVTSAVGSLPQFIAALITDSRDHCNAAIAVDLEPGDFDIPAMAELAEAGRRGFLQRTYAFFVSQELEDVLVEEAKLYGAYPYITAEGKISFRMLRHAAQVEAPNATIDADRHAVGDDWIHYERQPLGVYNTVVIKTGYDPIEDEHTGREWVVRDIRAYGRDPVARTLEIAPLSQSPGVRTYDEILSVVQRIFGLFAGEYAVLQLDVTPHLFGVLLGDVVAVTSNKVPNDEGTLGVFEKRGIVISREWRLREGGGTGTLQILLTGQPLAGYAPSCPIESATLIGGTTYDLKLHARRADYVPAGTTFADFFQPGDLIRCCDWNPETTSIGTVPGIITAVDPSGETIRVELDAAATFGTNEQMIAYRRPSEIPIDHAEGLRVQHAYGAIADAGGIINWNGFTTGYRVFA